MCLSHFRFLNSLCTHHLTSSLSRGGRGYSGHLPADMEGLIQLWVPELAERQSKVAKASVQATPGAGNPESSSLTQAAFSSCGSSPQGLPTCRGETGPKGCQLHNPGPAQRAKPQGHCLGLLPPLTAGVPGGLKAVGRRPKSHTVRLCLPSAPQSSWPESHRHFPLST